MFSTRYLSRSPPGRVSCPYLIYINDIPVTAKASVSLFVDDTMFYTCDHNPIRAEIQLQRQLQTSSDWFRK